MKIGISSYPTIGGSGVVAAELGMGLAERGHEVHFITYAVPSRLDLCQPGIYFHQVSVPEYPLFEFPPYSLALGSHIAECATRYNLDIIHAHYAIPHAASAILAKHMSKTGLKVVTTLHGTDITLIGRDPAFMPVIKYAIEESDAVTAVSMFLRDEVCCMFTCDKHIDVVYNFVDPNDYKNLNKDALRKRFAPHGEKILVHASNFRPVKRTADVAEIFLKVRQSIPVKLILVGSGPDLSSVEQAVNRRGADKDLILLGNRESVTEVYAVADVLLLPSQTESFGLVALESMACGTPVVVSNAGGLPEVVVHGETGFMAPIGDVDKMSEFTLELLTKAGLHQKMSENGRNRAFERFHIDDVIGRYEKIYLQLLEG